MANFTSIPVYFPRKSGHENVWISYLVLGGLQAEGWATVKVAIRHKRRLPKGCPPFIPFALLDLRSTFRRKGNCHLFCRKSGFLFLSVSGFVLAWALIPQRTVKTFVVLVYLNGFEDRAACLCL